MHALVHGFAERTTKKAAACKERIGQIASRGELGECFLWDEKLPGFGEPTIGKLLGHALLETTERYAHLGNTSVREAAGRVSGHIARASGFAFEEAAR